VCGGGLLILRATSEGGGPGGGGANGPGGDPGLGRRDTASLLAGDLRLSGWSSFGRGNGGRRLLGGGGLCGRRRGASLSGPALGAALLLLGPLAFITSQAALLERPLALAFGPLLLRGLGGSPLLPTATAL
jgi:hypothetical protein